MDTDLLHQIIQLSPWLKNPNHPILPTKGLIPRVQTAELMDEEWDRLWTLLIGPRRSGKTTLGKCLAKKLLETGKWNQLLYLNCDYLAIRKWLKTPLFVSEALEYFSLKRPIIFIDEVQRLENPGLLLKAVIDLGLECKFLATGSSQIEIKSHVQEFLTGRHLSSLVLPFSYKEWKDSSSFDNIIQFGSYPQVLESNKKERQLLEIYGHYIQKDIIEILKLGHPDILQALITLLAHEAGQLINITKLATECQVSTTMIRNHLDILEKTFVIVKVPPFSTNKRSEITKNPTYYFIDNGFRNAALRNFSSPSSRSDEGLLVENFIFQEIYKLKTQNYLSFDIHFWRTKSGAEVDFVLFKNRDCFLPIEVKFQRFQKPTVSKSLRSFIDHYRPKEALLITKDFMSKTKVGDCDVHFLPLSHFDPILQKIGEIMN